MSPKNDVCCPSGIVVSDANCSAVGSGFEPVYLPKAFHTCSMGFQSEENARQFILQIAHTLEVPKQKSDEAHFWLNGYVNKQNCRIWSEANPHVYVETPLHPEKLTVWCALWAGRILLQKR
ncbi:transposable element Tc3 transposase [Trichonephila clavipes]|nr:transposable element Tc3 transposase [Trichonephila clavipes]